MAKQSLHGFVMREAATCGRMKPKPKTEREKALECLRQLEEHSPTWVATIRRYIETLEAGTTPKR